MTLPNFEIVTTRENAISIIFSGSWRLFESPPSAQKILQALNASVVQPSRVSVSVRDLLTLALAVPRREAPPRGPSERWLSRIGSAALASFDGAVSVAQFIGELSLALVRLFTGRAHVRKNDFLEVPLIIESFECNDRSECILRVQWSVKVGQGAMRRVE